MTCEHEIYSRYLGAERDSDGVEWLIVGCKTCSATMKFPALAKIALKYEAMRADYAAGLSCTQIAEKYGYKSRGFVVNLFERLGVKMRDRTEARLMAMGYRGEAA
jgi:hypothetical protein